MVLEPGAVENQKYNDHTVWSILYRRYIHFSDIRNIGEQVMANGDSDVGEKRVKKSYTFLSVDNIPIGHQHHYISECDVGDRCTMLET